MLIRFLLFLLFLWPSLASSDPSLADYGGNCDGTSDTAPAFEQAIHALKAGGTIRVPAGVCYVSRSIEITRDNVTIEGAGLGATLLIPGPAVKYLFDVHPANGSNSQVVFPSFRYFSVNGSKAPGATAFYVRSARYVFIDHVFTTNCFISYWVDRSRTGESPFTSTFHLSDFQIDDTPDEPNARGILIDGAGDDWFISNGRVYQNKQSKSNVGMELRCGAGFMIQNVDISMMGRGLLVDPHQGDIVRFGQISGLQCDTSWEDAALLDGTEAFASGYPHGLHNIVFVNCWFSSAGVNGGDGNGITLKGARAITIEASQILSNSLNGILIRKDTQDISILNNQISGNSNGYGNKNRTRGKYSGIYVEDGTQSFLISGNRIGKEAFFDNSQQHGVYLGSGTGNYEITDNHLAGNMNADNVQAGSPPVSESRK